MLVRSKSKYHMHLIIRKWTKNYVKSALNWDSNLSKVSTSPLSSTFFALNAISCTFVYPPKRSSTHFVKKVRFIGKIDHKNDAVNTKLMVNWDIFDIQLAISWKFIYICMYSIFIYLAIIWVKSRPTLLS